VSSRLGLSLLAVGLAGLVSCSSGGHHGATSRPADAALIDLADIRQGQCGAVAAQFDSAMHARLNASQTCTAWSEFVQQFGDYRGHGAPMAVTVGSDTVVRIPLYMAEKDGELRVTYDPTGKIAGLFLLRQGVPL
jgi:hypothetical protein